MTPARQREKALFESALDMTDPAERRTFLERACGEDSALRLRLERLLAAQEPAEAFLTLHPRGEHPVPATANVASGAAPPSGDRDPTWANDDRVLAESNVHIGRYKLVHRLGEGGCGVVYLAEQQEPVHRQVALKIIRLGISTTNIITRFRREQQAMAWMDHPNIARVLDADTTDTGRPYFVMELVRGIKITDYCNEHRLDVNARLNLFAQVCHAIQHAHQKGIIHRDIKPSNILISLHDGHPVPKVIDFGISKSIVEPLPESSETSSRIHLVGTPDYMSPEQAEPDDRDVDTRSDIYGLGVLLYELLTGHTPFDDKPMDKTSPDAIRRAIRERSSPVATSARVASLAPEELARLSAQRGVTPRELIASLRGDLDAITLRALEKNRQRRYETTNGLALDIARYRADEPVAAHPPSRVYYFRKLVRRNRQIFIAGTLVLITLLGGLGTSTRLYYKEREARREQSRLRNEAETSRAIELALRQKAEAREHIAQAAVHLSHNKMEAADELISEMPPDLVPASLETAGVLRTLGEWHAAAGRWTRSAQCFEGLARAITKADLADTDFVSRHLMPAGAAICEAGDPAAYEQFRQMAIARFARTANINVSEQIIKSSLLKPMGPDTLARLAPLAELLKASLNRSPTSSRHPYLDAWRSLAIGTFEYRRGNYEQSIIWLKRVEDYVNYDVSRQACRDLIFAMASQRLNQNNEAQAALAKARSSINDRFALPLNPGDTREGTWFDWINARIFLVEATAEIEGGQPATK
jgi:eukaryotic-like serine/threonine-protein kinase